MEGLVSQAKYERNKRILIRKWLRSDPDGRSRDELKRLAVDVENRYLKPTRKLVNDCVDELEKDTPDDQHAACYLFSQRVLRPWHCVRTYDCCDVMLERGAAHRLVKIISRYKEQDRWSKLVLLATDVLCILCNSTSRCQIVVRAGAFPVTLSLARTKSGVVQESAIGLLWGLLESQEVQVQNVLDSAVSSLSPSSLSPSPLPLCPSLMSVSLPISPVRFIVLYLFCWFVAVYLSIYLSMYLPVSLRR